MYLLSRRLITIFIAICLPISSFSSSHSYQPRILAKSLVKITVTGGNKGTVAVSGFIWKKKNWIVTSLHAMREGSDVNIQVLWSGDQDGAWNAEISRIDETSDLVLLEVRPGKLPLPRWKPLNKISEDQLPYLTPLYAVGYNGGAENWTSRKLIKGEGQSAKLRNIIPAKDVESIKLLGIPSLDLDVIYLEGSLLPGFSGAPIVNGRGKLVGISDGGLENGASNVSWGIPVKHLKDLAMSDDRTLPPLLASASQMFSAEVNSPAMRNGVSFGNFNFYHTKTRTLEQMIKTSDNPELLGDMLGIEDKILEKIGIDYLSLKFDVYEDVNNGFIITVPHGQQLAVVDDESLGITPGHGENYELTYQIGELNEYDAAMSSSDIRDVILSKYQNDEFDIQIAEDGDEAWKIGKNNYLVLELDVTEKYNTENQIGMVYNKVAYNKRTGLIATAKLGDFNQKNIEIFGEHLESGKLNCEDYNNYVREKLFCQVVTQWIYYVTSAHLTTL